jgi:hypothetical protein
MDMPTPASTLSPRLERPATGELRGGREIMVPVPMKTCSPTRHSEQAGRIDEAGC